MKRCPQCEFIYEDDQSLCDMDGVLLVFDSRTLPHLHALATVSAPLPEKGTRRSRMVPAFATLILMLAVASVYYVTTLRNATPPDLIPASVNTTVSEVPAVVPPAPTPAAEEPPKEEPPRETHSAPAPVAKRAAEPPRKQPATISAPPQPEPKKKDDSKVESILKKTGKILKKPFKF
ncbi:MAG TPA: hypothetical protein VHQ94_17905 [Pyrinomonadaceae bacterium]|nr:hypothetical protein [Pyrinomonadaceae bacterium]